MRQLMKGQSVFWNDPAGETSGKYKILDVYAERNEDITEEDIAEFDSRMILIGNGTSEAEVYAAELDVNQTKVIFRKWCKDGNIIALFPVQTNLTKQTVGSYMHLGQHSDADYPGIISATVPAKPEEYTELLSELKFIGYENLKVMQKYKPTFYGK